MELRQAPGCRHIVLHGTRLPMLGLAAYARYHKSVTLVKAVERASEIFLRRRLFKRASDGRVIHPEFVTLHYPLYWHYDYLGGLKAMSRIGRIRDPRTAEDRKSTRLNSSHLVISYAV